MKQFLAFCLASCLWSLTSGAKPPNIVFILADDLGITGNKMPDQIDGRSAVPLLNDPAHRAGPRTLYWHYPFNVIVKHPHHGTPLSPHSAIRVGDHKLIWDWHGRIELYHIPEDPFETNNLAPTNPTLALKLHRQLKDWLDTNVAPVYHPQPNPDFDPSAPGTPFPFKDLR